MKGKPGRNFDLEFALGSLSKCPRNLCGFPSLTLWTWLNSSPWLSHSPLKSHFNLKVNSSTNRLSYFPPSSPKYPRTENDTMIQPVAQARNWRWTDSTSPSIYIPKESPNSVHTTSSTHQLPSFVTAIALFQAAILLYLENSSPFMGLPDSRIAFFGFTPHTEARVIDVKLLV